MKKRTSPEVAALASQIDLIARESWRGLPALAGAEELQRDRITDTFKARGLDALAVESVIKLWPCILEAVRIVRSEHADAWNMYVSFIVRKAVYSQCWGGRGVVDTLAEKFRTTPYKLRKAVREIPFIIALIASAVSQSPRKDGISRD